MAESARVASKSTGDLQGNTAVDAARARELYKYFRPPAAPAHDKPDTVLAAHAQLVTWRLNTQRTMVSLVDRDTQYLVAESTKTLHLDGVLQHDDPDDTSGAGCVNVPKAGTPCEHTIALLPPADGAPACFEVLDLAQDSRFCTLDFVADHPRFRYYIGVPLRTCKGINIGSLFTLDDRVRSGATRAERDFLAVMADNVVQHLETQRDKNDRQRSTRMNMCMSTFANPGYHPGRRSTRSRSGEAMSPTTENPPDADSHSEGGTPADHLETFARAANVLRAALDLEEGGGGVAFLDTATTMSRRHPFDQATSNDESSSTHESDREATLLPALCEHEDPVQKLHASYNSPADVLAHACPPNAHGPPEVVQGHFTPMSPSDLSSLIARHPRGKLYTFEERHQLISSSSDEQSPSAETEESGRKSNSATVQAEAGLLQKTFPPARQVIFLPLWDTTTSRWSALFAYNCSPFREFSYHLDFLYCVAFSNCITTEIARLAALASDKLKSDFIGSISHELRSPLHGILASCEFLGETDCTSFQRSLIDTADSCGRTLLDTINMVLDYSKINAFERNTTKTQRSKRGSTLRKAPVRLQSHLNLYGDVDLAAITEEVVEGVATGHMLRAGTDGHEVLDPEFRRRSANSTSSTTFSPHKADVEVIVDVPMRDWTFWSQPGALRRIVMNLFGNSLKYTKKGFIQIKLEAEDADSTTDPKVSTFVTLTVKDSGQGISAKYLRTKLFTPFAQENSLTTGTGLGLSLVKSIVKMLDGDIDVESIVDVGTTVRVRLPMTKGAPAQPRNGLASTPTSAGSHIEREKDKSLDIVKAEASKSRIALYWEDKDEAERDQRESARMMRKSLEMYLEDWYGLSISRFEDACEPDIVITQDIDLNGLIGVAPRLLIPNCRTMVLVLCDTASAQSAMAALPQAHNFEYIRHPFGPYKLARAVRVCLERSAKLNSVPLASAPNTFESIAEYPAYSPLSDGVVNAVDSLIISSSDPADDDISIIKAGNLASREDSVNAQMAMKNAGPLQASDGSNDLDSASEFPFPHGDELVKDGTICPTTISGLLHPRPNLPPTRRTISPTRQEMNFHEVVDINPVSSCGALTNSPPTTSKPSSRTPRMLLVDDNHINLKLLQTFMKKRDYTAVTNAENGVQAVEAYSSLLHQTPPSPPDIILMDISMPLMDGFEATRRIRDIERAHNEQLPPMQTPPLCLIIALTGLASARDQSEAFTSGFDLYITKPVSFKEISRLMDNWERNGGTPVEGAAGVPHGAVSSGEWKHVRA